MQKIAPQHAISRFAGFVAQCRYPLFKNQLISWFIAKYNVDMSIAQIQDPEKFEHFNAFFTRALKEDARPINSNSDLVFPADGAISQLGDISDGKIFQAKGKDFSLSAILGGDPKLAETFKDGRFATIYLSPRDYHRVHMPITGKLIETIYVPGDLYSVNQTTAENIDELFARNERLVVIFDTEVGPMAMVLVGAMIVAGIETPWAGRMSPAKPYQYSAAGDASNANAIELEAGAELGRFHLDSTAIMLFQPQQIEWLDALQPGSKLKMGEAIARR